MRRGGKCLRTIVIALIATALCGCDSASEDDAPPIAEDWDVWVVTTDLCSTIRSLAVFSLSQDKSWSNETTEGEQGTVTLDGSYVHTDYTAGYNPEYDYEFVDLSLDFDGYSTDSGDDAVLFTGSATLDGTVHEATGSTASTYTGGWTLNGSFELRGGYSDAITVEIYFYEDSVMRDYSGSLTNGEGQSFTVTPDR